MQAGRQTVVTIAAAFAAAMVFAGCADRTDAATTTYRQPTTYRRAWSDDDVTKPDWISNPTRSGTVIAAWGSAPHDPFVGRGELRNRALDQARHELGRMVMVRVQSALKEYIGESRDADGVSVTAFSESISRTIAVQSIRSSYQQAEWIHPKTGELFVWAVIDSKFAHTLASGVAETATQEGASSAPMQAKLAADAGFAELDRILAHSFKDP